jgi:1-acyl-sn-glycerol-3-phosphate acyltransferase
MGIRADFKPLVRNHNFLKLWLAQIVSAIGDRLAQMALLGLIAGLAGQTLNELVSLTLFAALPGIFVGPFAAMAMDRIDRKKILVFADVLRGAMVVAIPFVYHTVYGTALVHSIVFLTSMLASLHGLTQTVVIPQIVGRENLLTANSLTSATGLISTLIGFSIVGSLVRQLSSETNFIINGLIYGLSASLMALLSVPRVAPKTTLRARQVIADLRTGVALIFSSASVRSLVLLSATFWAIAGFVYISVFALAMRELRFDTKTDADLFGIMMTCLGIGLVVGAFVISRFKQVAHYPHLPYFVLVPLGLSIALWARATGWWSDSFATHLQAAGWEWGFFASTSDAAQSPLADRLWEIFSWMPLRVLRTLVPSLGVIWIGIIGSAFLLPVDTSVQRQVPDELLGRIQSARAFLTGIGFCGAVALAGFLTQMLDASQIIFGFGVGVSILAAARILFSRVLRYQLGRFLLKLGMKVLFRLKIEGLENVPLDQPVVFAANHVSFMDGPTLAAAIPRRLYFFMNREAFNLRPWRRLFKQLGFIPLDRTRGFTTAVRRAVGVLSKGKNLVIFPEGDLTKDGRLGKFRHGVSVIARHAAVPIVPVATRGLFEVLPAGAPWIRFRRITVTFGEPILPAECAGWKRDQLTAEVRRRIAALLGESDAQREPSALDSPLAAEAKEKQQERLVEP